MLSSEFWEICKKTFFIENLRWLLLSVRFYWNSIYYYNTDGNTSHPAKRRRGEVVTTSLCASQRRCRYVSNETPNDVSVEPRQDVSIVRLHVVLYVCRDDVSRGRNNDVPSVRLHGASNKSQMKHPSTSQWYVTKTCQWYSRRPISTSLRPLL